MCATGGPLSAGLGRFSISTSSTIAAPYPTRRSLMPTTKTRAVGAGHVRRGSPTSVDEQNQVTGPAPAKDEVVVSWWSTASRAGRARGPWTTLDAIEAERDGFGPSPKPL